MMKMLQLALTAAGTAWLAGSYPLVTVFFLLGLSVWLYMTGRAFQWLARSDRHAPWVALSSLSRPTPRARAVPARTSRTKSRAQAGWGRRTQHA